MGGFGRGMYHSHLKGSLERGGNAREWAVARSSNLPWHGGIRSGVKTNGRKKAWIDTVNLQWWERRETMSREKHMVGLWELLVFQDERRLCWNEDWHMDKAERKAVINLKLMSGGHGSFLFPACVQVLTLCDSITSYFLDLEAVSLPQQQSSL